MIPAARVRAVAADEQRREPQLAREIGDGIAFGPVDPVGAVVDAVGGMAAAADAIARLEHGDGDAALRERACRPEPGEPRADHEHAAAAIAAAPVGG